MLYTNSLEMGRRKLSDLLHKINLRGGKNCEKQNFLPFDIQLKLDKITGQTGNKHRKESHQKQTLEDKERYGPPPPPPGNFKLHNTYCVTCKRMQDGKTSFRSSKTGREYNITRHYTCESSCIIYIAHCSLCKQDYVYMYDASQAYWSPK